VHKSEIVKKTLAPVWNERFEVQVPSREAAKFIVEVHDWDRVGAFPPSPPRLAPAGRARLTPFSPLAGASDKLGRAQIDLRDLEPFEAVERTVALSDFKNSSQSAGHIRVRLVFSPQFIYRSRKATSTFSAGKIGGTIGGGAMAVGGGIVGAGGVVGKAGVGAVGTVGKAGVHGVSTVGKGVGTVGKGVGKGVGTVGKGVFGIGRRAVGGGHGRSSSVASASELAALGDDVGYVVDGAGGADGVEVLASDMAVASPVSGDATPTSAGAGAGSGMGAEGTLTVTLGQLTGGGGGDGEKKAVVVKLEGGKTVLETHSHRSEANVIAFGDTATVKTPASGPVDLTFAVVHKKTLGSDKVLSSATLAVWQFVSPMQPNNTVTLPLAGAQGGELVVSLSVRPSLALSCRLAAVQL